MRNQVIVVAAALAVIASASFSAKASNYPPDYTYQKARVVHLRGGDGSQPGFISVVASGIMNTTIIGYKKSAKLSAENPDYIDAVIVAGCGSKDATWSTKTSFVKIGKEWGGNGYLSATFDRYSLEPSNCGSSHVEYGVAFSDGHGKWDSQGGANYRFESDDFYRPQAEVYDSQEQGPYNLAIPNDKIWRFLIEVLKR